MCVLRSGALVRLHHSIVAFSAFFIIYTYHSFAFNEPLLGSQGLNQIPVSHTINCYGLTETKAVY